MYLFCEIASYKLSVIHKNEKSQVKMQLHKNFEPPIIQFIAQTYTYSKVPNKLDARLLWFRIFSHLLTQLLVLHAYSAP